MIALRQEVSAGEQTVFTRRDEVEAALAARKASIRTGIRNTLRVGTFMVVVAHGGRGRHRNPGR